MKATTAVVSIITAIALWWLLPQTLVLPSPAQFQAAHAALPESEARYRASFEQSPVPMHMFDESGTVIGVSKSWLSLFGYDRDDVIGRPLSAFWPASSNFWDDDARKRLMTEREVTDVERQLVRQDGSVIDVLVSARLEQRSSAISVVGAVTDTTARKRAEEALRASEERLHQAQKMEAVGQLTGGMRMTSTICSRGSRAA